MTGPRLTATVQQRGQQSHYQLLLTDGGGIIPVVVGTRNSRTRRYTHVLAIESQNHPHGWRPAPNWSWHTTEALAQAAARMLRPEVDRRIVPVHDLDAEADDREFAREVAAERDAHRPTYGDLPTMTAQERQAHTDAAIARYGGAS